MPTFDPSIEFIKTLELPTVKFDNGMVYIDDDLETTQNSLRIIHLMKHVMIFVFKQWQLIQDTLAGYLTCKENR